MDSTQKAVKNQEICEPLQGNLGITQSSGLDRHDVTASNIARILFHFILKSSFVFFWDKKNAIFSDDVFPFDCRELFAS